jgi:hypothetical protein
MTAPWALLEIGNETSLATLSRSAFIEIEVK